MDKNKKIALTIFPLAIIGIGVFIYMNLFMGEPPPAQTESSKTNDAWVDEVKTDTVKKANKIEAIRQTYHQQHVDQRLYDGIVFGGETVQDEPSTTQKESPEENGNDEKDSIPPVQTPAPGASSAKKNKKIQKAPVRREERIAEKSTLPVTPSLSPTSAPAPAPRVRKGFLSSTGAEQPPASASASGAQTLSCVVLEDAQVQSGSMVNLLLLQEAVINGEPIPKNTIIHAEASFSQTTMNLSVASIGSQAGNWIGYDVNGNKGFVIAGGNSSDNQLAKQTAGDVFDAGTDVVSSKINVPLLSRIGGNAGRQKIQDVSITIPKGFKVKLK